jgi:cytochrome c553
MLRALKWIGVSLLTLVVVAVGFVWFRSSRIITRAWDVPLTTIAVPTDSASIAEGRRLALLRGCYQGCHGPELAGGPFFEQAGVARIVAPDLTRIAAEYSDAELERAIRHGVRRDGRTTWIMPSSMFYHLSDADLGAIIAFIRSHPRTDGPATEVEVGPLGRLGIALGQYNPQAGQIEHDAPRIPAVNGESGAPSGEYLARTTCAECHGATLQGSPGPPAPTPSLAIVASYSDSAFAHLMRSGKAMGEREVGLMSEVARARFAHFTDAEVAALHGYLRALPPAPAARQE